MNETAARVRRLDITMFSAPFYTWEATDKPVSVAIPMSMIEELEREAVESFRCLTSRGSEIGGVLYGNVTPGNPALVTLVSFELVPCDYSRGPLYRLAEADLSRLDRTVADAAGAGHSVAGFFRSHTRKNLAVDNDDLAVLDTRFASPHHVALLIRPFAAKASVAGFFIRENGKVQGESSPLEFPFRASQLTASEARPAAHDQAKAGPRAQIVPIASRRESAPVEPHAVAAAPSRPPAEKAPTEAHSPAPPAVPALAAEVNPEAEPVPILDRDVPAETAAAATPAAGKSKLYALGGLAAAAVIGFGLFVSPGVLRNSKGTVGLPEAASLTLRAERSGAELLLTWNRDSSAIRGASRAMLQISDGQQHENVEMDLAQLRNGSIVYSPVTSDVVFKMDVTATTGKSFSESVRVLSSRPSPMPDAQAQTPANKTATGTAPAAAGTPPVPAEEAAAEEVKPAAPARTLKAFNTESLGQRLRPATQADLPDALAGIGAAAGPTTALPSLNLTAGAAAPPPPPSVAAPSPVLRTGGQIQPAELIRRRDPEYPKLARDAGAKGLVQLTATVGADGRVKSVKVVKGHPLLIRAASDAVMQWLYKPTILNGVAVETTTDVTLNFVNDK